MAVDRWDVENMHFFCIWPTFTHSMQLTPEWQDTELQPCWCPGSFHQRLCWRHRTMESGKKTLIPSHWVIMYFKSTRLMMLSVTNSIFHLPGAVHQPARGAALLLRSQAAPSPCSRRSQVASFQVKSAFVFCKCWLFLSTTAPALAWSWTKEARRWSKWSVCLSPAPSRPFTLICTGKYWMRSF